MFVVMEVMYSTMQQIFPHFFTSEEGNNNTALCAQTKLHNF